MNIMITEVRITKRTTENTGKDLILLKNFPGLLSGSDPVHVLIEGELEFLSVNCPHLKTIRLSKDKESHH